MLGASMQLMHVLARFAGAAATQRVLGTCPREWLMLDTAGLCGLVACGNFCSSTSLADILSDCRCALYLARWLRAAAMVTGGAWCLAAPDVL
jgi:hypothetical protein